MIFIALGGNLGNRQDYLAQARAALTGYDIEIVKTSSPVETAALIPDGAPEDWNKPYLNQLVAIETHLAPLELLTCLKLIEHELGRRPAERWAPREIDLDLIAYHDEIMVSDRLTLPHPQMDQRVFVLRPLAQIAPGWRHPALGKTVEDLLTECAA